MFAFITRKNFKRTWTRLDSSLESFFLFRTRAGLEVQIFMRTWTWTGSPFLKGLDNTLVAAVVAVPR